MKYLFDVMISTIPFFSFAVVFTFFAFLVRYIPVLPYAMKAMIQRLIYTFAGAVLTVGIVLSATSTENRPKNETLNRGAQAEQHLKNGDVPQNESKIESIMRKPKHTDEERELRFNEMVKKEN